MSYSSEDRRIVDTILPLLKAVNRKVFIDFHSIIPGDHWQNEIAQAIKDCKVFLLFWSADAAKSKWVRKEYRQALKLGKRIIPVCFDDAKMPPEIDCLQKIDFRPVLSWVAENRRITNTIKKEPRIWRKAMPHYISTAYHRMWRLAMEIQSLEYTEDSEIKR